MVVGAVIAYYLIIGVALMLIGITFLAVATRIVGTFHEAR